LPHNIFAGLAGMAQRIMEDVNFALRLAFAPLTPAQIADLERDAEIRKALAEAAANARQRQWEDWQWLEEQRRRQYQEELDAIHTRARRRSTSGPSVPMPVFTTSLPSSAKSKPVPVAEIQPLQIHPTQYAPPPKAKRSASIKKQFRQAAKATKRDDDKSKSRQRRRRGETQGQFQLVRRILRRLDMRPKFRSAAAKTGRRSMSNPAPPETFAGFDASPWSNPLNGLDFYAGDLAGFSEFDDGFDGNPAQIFLDR
jgi:hypothetical protein